MPKIKIMKFLEQDLEDIIWNAIQDGKIDHLYDRNFPLTSNGQEFFRQYNFGEGFGVADIISVETETYKNDEGRTIEVNIGIYELKRDKIDYSALDQALRYGRACQKIVSNLRSEYPDYSISKPDIKIYLIGRTIEKNSSFCYIGDVLENVYIYTYNFDALSGITFNREYGYLPSNNHEPNMTLSKKQLLRTMIPNIIESIDFRVFRRLEKEHNIKNGLPF